MAHPGWQAALDRYYIQLDQVGLKKTSIIEKDLWAAEGPNDLIEDIRRMTPQGLQVSKAWISAILRLEPVLLDLNDFATVVAQSLGMAGRVATLLWGSLRLIMKVKYEDDY